MGRYIDADALVQDLKEQYEDVFGKIKKEVRPEDFYIERNHAYYASLVDKELNILFDYLDEIPTADVAEVKHGEWVIKSETIQLFDDVDEELYVECPFCKRTFYVPFEFEDEKIIAYAKKHYPYCNCGAKMDGGVKDGKIC